MSEKANVSFSGVKVEDNVRRTIVRFAQSHKIDLIVIGSRGPDPHIEMFLGSVANHIVQKSQIPVTVLK